ncbi:MAG: choice-of-anchor D domain-containing protein, partial [Dehalococcoidia bacterium]
MAFARKNAPVTVIVLSLALIALLWQISSAPGLGHAADDPGPPGPGYPLIVITTAEVEMRSTIDFDETEATTRHFFPAADPQTTGGLLEITIEGAYGGSYNTATPFTEGTPLSEMGNTGEDCVPVSATFALSPEEMSVLLEDGMAEITIQNSELVGPSCERNRHTVSLRYRNPLGEVAFGDVPVGRMREMPLTVFNPGSSLLQVSSMISDDAAFVASPASLDVPAGESRTARVRYSATSIGPSSASLLLTSDDLTQPVVEVMLSAEGVDPPIIQVTPAELSATLYEGEQAVQAVTIRNDGGSALDFQIKVGPPRGDVAGACIPVQALVTEFFHGLTLVDLTTGATTPVSTELAGSS